MREKPPPSGLFRDTPASLGLTPGLSPNPWAAAVAVLWQTLSSGCVHLNYFNHQLSETDTIAIIPILQMGRLRHRAVMQVEQSPINQQVKGRGFEPRQSGLVPELGKGHCVLPLFTVVRLQERAVRLWFRHASVLAGVVGRLQTAS